MGNTKIVLDLQSDLILNNALIVRPSGIVKSDLPGLVDDINGLTMSIAGEASARAAADQQLSNDLSDLQNYVDTTVDSAIATLTSDLADETAARIADVDAEETRALAAEAALSSDLADLQTYVDTTVDSAIATLTSDLADETAARIADVDAEETRALAAEGVLQSNIDVEKGRIDAILDGSTINLDQFREVVEFVEGIDLANDNSLISAVNDINASIDAEETRALAAEASLQAAIDAEAAARISADADLDGRIVDIISNTNAPIIDSFSEVVAQMEAMPGVDESSIIVDSENNISLKDTVAAGSQGVRTFEGLVNVGSEPSLDANFADLSLVTKGYVTGVADGISTNLNNLQTYVNTTVDSAIATLTSDIDNEEAARIAADNQLQANIDAINTDITGTVNNESAARIAGDAYLQSEIDALALTDGETIDVNYAANTIRLKEVVSAPDSGVRTFEGDIKVGQQPDTLPSYNDHSLITKGILDARVSSEVSTINTSISDEVSRAQSAEAQLQSNIDVEKGRIDAILDASEADKDNFAEIVQLINSVDTTNDQAFASYVLSNDARVATEEQERLRLTDLLGQGLIDEQIAREDGDAALQHEFDILPMTDGETIELNYTDNTIRLKEFVNMPDSGVRVFEGDLKADSQPENRGTFNELSYVTKNYVDNKVTNDLSDAVAQEMAERIAADAALTELIDVKKGEAIAISNEYTDVETQRASSVEGYLQSEIDALALTDGETIDVNYAANTIRLKEVVAAPDSGVRTFEGDIKVGNQPNSLPSYNDLSLITKGIMDTRLSEEVGNINTSISDEVSRAQDAEAQLQLNIDTERERIDAILLASDADKDNFAEIVQLINSVDTDNDQAFASYVLSNDARVAAEEQERLRLTNILGEGLVTEQIAREDADAAIHYELDNLPMTDGETIDVNYADNTIKLRDIVAAPASGYRVFEGDLKLNAQPETDPNFNDLSLITKYYVDNKVSTDLTSAIEQEEADRIAADAGLLADLNSEVQRAQSAEASLQAAIDAEASARLAADADLDIRINDIISNTNAPIIDSFAEVVAQMESMPGVDESSIIIDSENNISLKDTVSAPTSGVRTFEGLVNVSSEPSLDANFTDFSLVTNGYVSDLINLEESARIADITAEETRAIAAEEALQAAIDAEASARLAADADLDIRINDIISNSNSSLIDSFAEVVTQMEAMPGVDESSIIIDSENNISLKEIVSAPASGVRTFGGLVNVGSEPSLDENFVDLSLVTKGYVTGLLDAEEAARIADVDAEEARALAAEAALSATFSAALSDEITRATFAELTLSNDLSDETAARISVDTILQSNIDVEKGRIDAILLASDADKDNFAEIVTLINSVDTENDQAFASYVLSNNAALSSLSTTFSAALSAEEAARIADVDAEEARALAAEAALSSDLADLQTYVDTTVDSAIATLTSDLADETAARIADVDAEEARALAAEGVLQTNINTEESARIAADITLQGNIDSETSRAQIAETAISTNLVTETNRATTAETLLQSNIDVEKGRIDAILLASDADKDNFAEIVTLINSVDTENDQAFASYVLSNNAALAAEVLRAETSEATLSATFSAALSAEEVARIAGDAQLSSDLADLQSYVDTTVDSAIATLTSDLADETAARIADVDAEEARALAAEAALSATFSTALAAETFRAQAAEVQLSNDLSDETSYRIAADTALQSNIDVEKGRIDAILLASDADKDNFAEIVTLINSVDTENDQAFASYVLSNNAALSSLSSTFSSALSAEEAARIADVDAEEARALAAELVLTNDLADEILRATIQENVLNAALSTEIARAYDAEAVLQSNINAEVTRATTAEALLQTNINTEANERMAEDITLQGNIDIEAARAQAAETAIATDLATEIADRIAAVSSEETRAMLAEATLSATFSAAISSEETRAIAAEGVLQSNIDVEKGRIDSILLASDADKDSFAEIVQLINSVDTTNDTAFASYVLSNDAALAAEVLRAETSEATLSATFSAAISSEVSRATAAELVLTNDLATEVSRATAAEGVLTSALAAEEASRIAGDSTLQSSLNNEIADRIAAGQSAQSALDSETTRAIAAEGVLTSDLATEVSRAIAAEATLSATFSAALSSETARAIAAEGVLTSDLASEVSRALAAEATLSATFSAALSAETFRAQAAEVQLQNELSDETSYRIDADTLLQSNIDVEKGRIDAILLASDADKDSFAEIVSLINSVDTTNDTAFASYVLSNDAALTSEVSRALAAEAALSATFSAAISAEVSARIADVDAEETRALAAEAALAADFANIYCKKVSVSGTPNGVLTSFSLASPLRLGSEMIYLNGLLMEEGEDYTTVLTSGKVTSVTFSSAPTSAMKVVAYGVY